MGVPCPGCGREYDVSLFEFGRTLHCSCGRRVGLARRERRLGSPAAPSFFADAMLGRVPHWLRILGFDCAYEAHVEDEALVRRAVLERRVVLTCDRRLPEEWRVEGLYVVRAERPFEQLRELVARFGLSDGVRLFTRCSRCNQPLLAASQGEVAGRVPPRVAVSHQDFRCCPGCGRVYWEGSHTERMRRVVEQLLEQAPQQPPRAGRAPPES